MTETNEPREVHEAQGPQGVPDRTEVERVRINLTLSQEAGELLERIMRRRFPSRARVHSLTIEQLIREEARREKIQAGNMGAAGGASK